MKKKLFFAAVVATALAGCSSNENLENDLTNVANPAAQEDGRVPVVLGLTSNDVQVFKTRGTGTVGDIDDGTGTLKNIYNAEDLWVLMTTVPKQGTPWGFTKFEDPIIGNLFDGTFKARPYGYDGSDTSTANEAYGQAATNDVDGTEMAYNSQWGLNYTAWNNGQVKYYPNDGTASDFFAFHIDDAAVTTIPQTYGSISYNSPEIVKDNDSLFVNFKIDGSQDLLAGKATNYGTTRGFTAKKARENVVPSIPMSHLLTRFTFDLVPGHQDALGVIVDSIKVYGFSSGKLKVAYNFSGNDDEVILPSKLIKWVDADSTQIDSFYLKKSPATILDANGKNPLVGVNATTGAGDYLTELTTDNVVAPTGSATEYTFVPERIGHAMFVQPNQTEFKVVAFMRFPITGYSKSHVQVPYTFYIRLRDNAGHITQNGLEIGKSYNVQLLVYGLSKVVLRTTLEAWEEGGDISIDTDLPWHTYNYWDLFTDPSIEVPTTPAPSPTYSEVTNSTGNENPSALGWYEKVGDAYVLSSDTTVSTSKTYYTQN